MGTEVDTQHQDMVRSFAKTVNRMHVLQSIRLDDMQRDIRERHPSMQTSKHKCVFPVHDVQLDYYGRRLASCSSDTTIKIFDVVGDQINNVSTLYGHQGPVFEVAWAHPKFGNILASCGFDNKVILWQEQQNGEWAQIYQSEHSASVNSLSFAPHELGFILASASSDGSLGFIIQGQDQYLEERIEGAHPGGSFGVSFSPAAPSGSLVSAQTPSKPQRRLVSCGCDKSVKIWKWDSAQGWSQDGQTLTGHKDWVRDVAWCPNLGLPSNTIASASQDGTVVLWCESPNGVWEPVKLPDFKGPVYRVSWSVTGQILSVSDSTNSVTLWKETSDKNWQPISA